MVSGERIFLAYAREDQEQVFQLYDQLKNRGFDPWVYKIDLVPGQLWRTEIPESIKSAKVFLACLSKVAVAKESYLQREFRIALSAYADLSPGTLYLVPVRLDDCEVPDLHLSDLELKLSDFQWVDLFEENGFDRLVGAIELAFEGRSKGDKLETAQRPSEPDPDPSGTAAVDQKSAPQEDRRTAKAETAANVSSRRRQEPAIKAAWIGAAAVIIAGLLTSPWLIELFQSPDLPVTIEKTSTEESKAAPTGEMVPITELQYLLIDHGYEPGTPDGRLTEETRSAISDAEKALGLPSTGLPSEQLLLKLKDRSRQLIAEAQRLLKSLGRIEGEPSGILTGETVLAIETAELEWNLPFDGKPDQDLLSVLRAELRGQTSNEPVQLADDLALRLRVEKLLFDLGYLDMPPIGQETLESREAIVRAETELGLSVDGKPDLQLYRALSSASKGSGSGQ